jgi:hypothetical protein
MKAPPRAAKIPEYMNALNFTLLTFIPTDHAEFGLKPIARIRSPVLVRKTKNHVRNATRKAI